MSWPRPHLLVLLLALVSISACSSGYGPPFDSSQFGPAAKVARNGQTVLFTFHYEVYLPAEGWRAFPDGGMAKHVTDTNHILALDLKSGKLRVLKSYSNLDRSWSPGSWNISVNETLGDRTIITLAGQTSGKYRQVSRKMWLDLDDGSTSDLPVKKELKDRGHDLKYLYLVDPGGTLVLVSHPTGQDGKYLWLRAADGTLHEVGPIVDYYGYRDGELHFYRPDNKYLIRTLSGFIREGAYKEYLAILDHREARSPRKAEVQVSVDTAFNGSLTVTKGAGKRVVTAEQIKKLLGAK